MKTVSPPVHQCDICGEYECVCVCFFKFVYMFEVCVSVNMRAYVSQCDAEFV